MKNTKNKQFWRLFVNLKNSNATFWVILNTVGMSQNYLLAVLNFDAKIWKMQHWCRIFAPKLTNLKKYFIGFWFSRKFKQNLVCNVTKNETFFLWVLNTVKSYMVIDSTNSSFSGSVFLSMEQSLSSKHFWSLRLCPVALANPRNFCNNHLCYWTLVVVLNWSWTHDWILAFHCQNQSF